MPVYLCTKGKGSTEPWRHGMEVYGQIFDIGNNAASSPEKDDSLSEEERTAISTPIRRIRHAEVVLVDDVCLKFGHYWLRLRWPGPRGEFAGYVCMGPTSSVGTPIVSTILSQSTVEELTESAEEAVTMALSNFVNPSDVAPAAPTRQPPPSPPPSPGFYTVNENQSLRCLRTGITFPSDPATLKLLPSYDDGLEPPVAIPNGGNFVFCRICREGLHEDDNEEEATENKAAENPLLAPCECSGSMAFVHYLCVEQWRCRSRHPEARNGLNCETCSKPYALPPPSSRPNQHANNNNNNNNNVIMEEDWLEAMPPHVMAALRHPHIWWQIGTAMVRRRWLRPLAPILLSPLVALYCRARRLMKKRGVSRRRWACSLCRRRARWKCVRCLRSYYCSRQCQNVSWHIVHKHVCYKPARFWWSVVVYGSLILLGIPGILRDPFIYDLLVSIIPATFYLIAVIGGGIATLSKRTFGLDLRGRMMELLVVAVTAWLVYVSWGVVWAFFGETDSCVGVMVKDGAVDRHATGLLDVTLKRLLLQPIKKYFMIWDTLLLQKDFISRWVCSHNTTTMRHFVWFFAPYQHAHDGCFVHLPLEEPLDLLQDAKCGSDVHLVSWLWLSGAITLVLSTMWKRRRRHRHQD